MMSKSDNSWIPETFSAVTQGLSLKPATLRRINCEQFIAYMDGAGLSRLVEPLPLAGPSEVAAQLERIGGPWILFSPAFQSSVTSWIKTHKAAQVLRELSGTISMLLRAYRQGRLSHPHATLRILPVMAMSGFVPGSGVLRGDLARILGSSREDVPVLINSFRMAALSGSKTVTEIDQRIKADPVWSAWAQTFLEECRDLTRLSRPTTYWEFAEPHLSQANGQGISHWLFRRR